MLGKCRTLFPVDVIDIGVPEPCLQGDGQACPEEDATKKKDYEERNRVECLDRFLLIPEQTGMQVENLLIVQGGFAATTCRRMGLQVVLLTHDSYLR